MSEKQFCDETKEALDNVVLRLQTAAICRINQYLVTQDQSQLTGEDNLRLAISMINDTFNTNYSDEHNVLKSYIVMVRFHRSQFDKPVLKGECVIHKHYT